MCVCVLDCLCRRYVTIFISGAVVQHILLAISVVASSEQVFKRAGGGEEDYSDTEFVRPRDAIDTHTLNIIKLNVCGSTERYNQEIMQLKICLVDG